MPPATERTSSAAFVRNAASLDFIPRLLHGKLHYSWVVLVCALVLVTVAAGARNAFGVLVTPLTEQFGWSVNVVSFAYFVLYIPAVPLTLIGGAIADRFGPRLVIFVGALLFAASLVLTATVAQVWQFYLYYAVVVGGVSIVFMTILTVSVSEWFERGRGLATGAVFAATGVGTFVFAPLFGGMIEALGWHRTFVLLGGAMGALVVLAAMLLRSRPADLGIGAYGQTGAEARKAASVPVARVSLAQVRRTGAFWCLTFIHLFGCLGHAVLLAHVVHFGRMEGVTPVLAAGLLSAAQGTSVLSRFGTPLFVERWGARGTLAVGFLLQGGSILLYLLADGTVAWYLVSVLFGLGLGAEMSAFPVVNRRYYGAGAPLNTIHAWEFGGGMLGMGVGGWLGGAVFQMTGTQMWSIVFASAATLLALPFILALPSRRTPMPLVAPDPVIPASAAVGAQGKA